MLRFDPKEIVEVFGLVKSRPILVYEFNRKEI